jgi:hypothetical protein
VAGEYEIRYRDMIEMAASGEGIIFGTDAGRDDFYPGSDKRELFWHHLQIATGRIFDEKHREGTYFSCSC